MIVNIFGDICLQGIDPSSFAYDGHVSEIMRSGVNIGNLESPVTTSETEKPMQARNIKASLHALEVLAPFDAVSLANNHIQDYGDTGCRDTISALDSMKIAHFGLGRNREEAMAPLIIERDGCRMALLGATRYANARGSYGTSPEILSRLRKVIRTLKREGCLVIPYFHWGYEYVRLPAPRERRIAHACIDAGADLVIGAHPHVYQAVEEYRGRKIFYSLGNFIFNSGLYDLAPQADDPRLTVSFFLTASIERGRVASVQLHGYQTGNTGVRSFGPAENQALLGDVDSISSVFKAGYPAYWKAYYRQAAAICMQNRKVRHTYQRISSRKLADRCRILLAFNSQDLRNRLACRAQWLFK